MTSTAVYTRRAWPIHAYTGPNGSGKSLAAVLDSMESLKADRPVLSTVRLTDWNPQLELDEDGRRPAHPLYSPLRTWADLLDAEHCDVLLDEVTGVASSREFDKMPAAVANLLVQLRRRDVVLRWTAPSWSRADTIIRECTQAVTVARSYWPTRREGERIWRPRRVFRWITYDADSFDEWTKSARDKARRLDAQWFYAPGKDVLRAYDTLDSVDRIATVLDSGRCADCGGVRRAPECGCDTYTERRRAEASSRRSAGRGAPSTAGSSRPHAPHEHDHSASDADGLRLVEDVAGRHAR